MVFIARGEGKIGEVSGFRKIYSQLLLQQTHRPDHHSDYLMVTVQSKVTQSMPGDEHIGKKHKPPL